MREDGFVLCVTPEAFRSEEFPSVTTAGPELGTAVSAGLKLFATTVATTPEAVSSRQPLLHDRLLVALSGRIDNRDEIADSLGDSALKTQPDCKLLAVAYERWGSCLTCKVIGE